MSSFLDKKTFLYAAASYELGKLLSDSEEKPYSTIFASLNHPVRRKILRMLSHKPMGFSEILEALGVSSSFLTYHIENLGELVNKTDNGKYRLSNFGEAAIATMTKVEEIPRAKPSRLDRVFRISLKQLLVLVLVIAVASASFVWASDRIETHKRWASMMEMSQLFMVDFDRVYVRLPDKFTNESYPTHFWIRDELSSADWVIEQLMRLDKTHGSQLFKVEDLINTLRDPATDTVQLNGSQFWFLSNAIHTIAQKLPDAYWNPLNGTDVNSETGPSFWYFGPSPPDEAILQEVATLAIQAKETIVPSA